MNDRASEAVVVALAVLALFFLDGTSIGHLRKFSLRWLFIWTTIIALVLGTITVLARIKT
jgi:hypothetical protein